jgi:hypothetical protein
LINENQIRQSALESPLRVSADVHFVQLTWSEDRFDIDTVCLEIAESRQQILCIPRCKPPEYKNRCQQNFDSQFSRIFSPSFSSVRLTESAITGAWISVDKYHRICLD